MIVSEAIIRWLKEFNPENLWAMQKINTDVMHNNVDYVLVKEPVRNVKTFISGTQVITEHYQFQARLPMVSDSESVENSEWLETLTEWIDERDKNGEYPKLQSNTVQAIGISSPFYVGRTESRKAVYQMTIFIRYMRKE